jgi:hypothetical protein
MNVKVYTNEEVEGIFLSSHGFYDSELSLQYNVLCESKKTERVEYLKNRVIDFGVRFLNSGAHECQFTAMCFYEELNDIKTDIEMYLYPISLWKRILRKLTSGLIMACV